jgi:hypothetical protein
MQITHTAPLSGDLNQAAPAERERRKKLIKNSVFNYVCGRWRVIVVRGPLCDNTRRIIGTIKC